MQVQICPTFTWQLLSHIKKERTWLLKLWYLPHCVTFWSTQQTIFFKRRLPVCGCQKCSPASGFHATWHHRWFKQPLFTFLYNWLRTKVPSICFFLLCDGRVLLNYRDHYYLQIHLHLTFRWPKRHLVFSYMKHIFVWMISWWELCEFAYITLD